MMLIMVQADKAGLIFINPHHVVTARFETDGSIVTLVSGQEIRLANDIDDVVTCIDREIGG